MKQRVEVVLLDSVTEVTARQRGHVIVTGSHGGISVARYALEVPAALYVFNDAGIGKDEAGVAALAVLQAAGQPALTVAHSSARIGEAGDTWAGGAISRVNGGAAALGLAAGQPLRPAVQAVFG